MDRVKRGNIVKDFFGSFYRDTKNIRVKLAF